MSQYCLLRDELIITLGSKCQACGQPDVRVLQIDHVYGDGADERRCFKNGLAYLRHIRDELDSGRYQLLCCNCNWLKRIINSEDRRFSIEVIDDLAALADEYNPDNPP